MTAWDNVLAEMRLAIKESGTRDPFFRGHADATWPLLPGIARLKSARHAQVAYANDEDREQGIYLDFVTRAGELLPNDDAWTHAFVMQHHGMPTRLLDWTETAGVAIFFALHAATSDAAVWILDPYALNELTWRSASLPNPRHLNGDYAEYFIEGTKNLEAPVLALAPLHHNPRVSRQRSGFTLHRNITTPLEVLYPDVVRKVTIPKDAFSGGHDFLRFSGISEFSLFPDLDALARELKGSYC